MKLFIKLCLLFLLSIPAFADTQPLDMDQAYAISAQLFGNDTIVLKWQIAPGHYLYKDRFKFIANTPNDAHIGTILYPAGEAKSNAVLGKYDVYTQTVTIPVPIIGADPQNTVLQVSYQGCAEDRYCYPPATREIHANFSAGTTSISAVSPTHENNQEAPYLKLLSKQHITTVLLTFLGFGLLLSFTPCVLPMLPILSGIIVGHQKTTSTNKAFTLSLIYVLSMAVTYAVAGILIGLIGASVQAFFQKTWVIALFSLIFVLLALSLFGLYQIKLPARFEERIANISRHQKSGHFLGVAIMGCLSTLIVSPCVTPALVGVLSYIGQTGDAWLGGAALFAMGIGMGIPLLAVGVAGGKLLPKAGNWMRIVESIFGVILLVMAIWMLSRIIPAALTLALWAALLMICSIYLGALSTTPSHGWGKLWKGMGLVLLVYGVLLLVGSAQGNNNPLRPINLANDKTNASTEMLFAPVKNLSDVENTVIEAKAKNKPVVLDFYADWCVNCKEMQQTVFKDPSVRTALSNFVSIQADITQNTPEDKILLQHFDVVGPPTLVFFDSKGHRLKTFNLVGKVNKQQLLSHIHEVLQQS